MINYEASAINSNVTLLQKMNKIEKYLLDNQLGNVFVTYQTLADDRLSDSDIQELNDRVIGKGDLLIDNDGYLYVITGFNEHTVYIDFNNRIHLGDTLSDDELTQIQQMIDNTFVNLDPITITTNENGVLGNEEYSHTVAIGDSINLQDGTNPTAPSNSVFIGYDLGSTVQTGDTMYGESNVVIGDSSDVHGDQNIIIGKSSNVTGYRSTAIGFNAVVNADNAVQIGTGTNSTSNSLKFKTTTIIDGNGKLNIPNGINGTTGQVLMKKSNTENDYDWQTPSNVPNGGTTDQLLAKNSNTDGDTKWVDSVPDQLKSFNDIVIGLNAQNNYNGNLNGIAIGKGANYGTNAGDTMEQIAIGNNATATKQGSIAIGKDATSCGYGSVVIGQHAATGYEGLNYTGNYCVAIGYDAGSATQINSTISIGSEAHAEGNNSCQIGYGTNNIANSLQFRSTQIVDGNGKLNIPNGVNGTTGQVLTKLSNAENDYAWQTPSGGGGGGSTSKLVNVPMLMNYTADASFSSIQGISTTIVIDDGVSQTGLNLETDDATFDNYIGNQSMFLYAYFTSGGDMKNQLVYGEIAEDLQNPGTYLFTGFMPMAPETLAQ